MKLPEVRTFINSNMCLAEEIEEFSKYYHEAAFQLDNLEKILRDLSKGSRILEIGSGIGLVSSHLAAMGFLVTALEPSEGSFKNFLKMKKIVEEHVYYKDTLNKIDVDIKFEAFQDNNKFDFIYAYNSLQFMPNLEIFFSQIEKYLKSGGRFYFVCPNYCFPYEQHFNSPIIINRNITQAFLKILYFFKRKPFDSLKWNEINGINFLDLKRIKKTHANLSFEFSSSILQAYINRIKVENNFKKRKNQLIVKLISHFPTKLYLPKALSPVLECIVQKK